MKIKIIYNFTEGPTGGGNQFLKALKHDFSKAGLYTENQEEANVFLFNSYHNLKEVIKLRKGYPRKVFIHRLGPVFYLHRGKLWKLIDKAILSLSQELADGFIFQSKWALREAEKLGFKVDEANCQVILNWSDKDIFYPLKEKVFIQGANQKIKLISTSWSSNQNKGFAIYKFLDENLDFNKYEMVFLGNLPKGFAFKNIKHIKAVSSNEVSRYLRQSDIFITGASNEACSNALIEAIACSLPCLALNSASNPEILKKAGEVFNDTGDLLNKLEKVTRNYSNYLSYLPVRLQSKDYLQFIERLFTIKKRGQVKRIFLKEDLEFLKIKSFLFLDKIINKIKII